MSPDRSRPGTLLVLVVTLAVVAVAAIVAYVVWPRGSEFERAAALLPEDTVRVAWTDWAGVREELDATDVRATGASAEEFLGEAGDLDLSSASPTAGTSLLIADAFGFSPLTSEWEVLGQGRDGMVLILKLDEDADLGEIADAFEEVGFSRPDKDELSGEVWTGGPDVITNVPGLGDPVLQHVAFLEDENLLVASDAADYLADAMPVVKGDKDGLDLGELVDPIEDPLAAVAFASDFVCEDLSMGEADEGAQALAEELVEDAGGVSPLTGYVAALQPDHRMSLVFDFETDKQAEKNAGSRRELAGMDDPGQLVSYPDVFRVDESEADGHRVVLRLKDVVPDAFALTNTTQGPVLLATC
jgi:hypothetical protein